MDTDYFSGCKGKNKVIKNEETNKQITELVFQQRCTAVLVCAYHGLHVIGDCRFYYI